MTSNSLSLRDLGWSPRAGRSRPQAGRRHCLRRSAALHRTTADLLMEGGSRRIDLTSALPPRARGRRLAAGRRRPAVAPARTPVAARATRGGTRAERQLIAANLDTLFIVQRVRRRFQPGADRALSGSGASGRRDAGGRADRGRCLPRPPTYRDRARDLSPLLPIETVNALDPPSAARLAPWCGFGHDRRPPPACRVWKAHPGQCADRCRAH